METGRTAHAIALRGLTKTFGSVVANEDIHLWVDPGEILSLLGENGSGKTTLMNMLSGIYRPDSGEIYVRGERCDIRSPKDAIDLGIGMIHQHFKLVDVLSVAENIVLGTKPEKGKDRRAIAEEIARISAAYGLSIDPDRKVYELSVGEKQTVEILKVLYRGARVLILDEPTAVLTPQEIERLFSILRRMRENGGAVILITHKLNEVMEVSDRITILRKGRAVDTVLCAHTSIDELTERMVGHAIDLSIARPETVRHEELLDVHRLSVTDAEGVAKLRSVSFMLSGGEILGVAGVAGSGQKELCEAVAGLQPIQAGAIFLHDKLITGKTPREITALGVSMSFIPEDRLGMGLVPGMSIVDNLLLKDYHHQKGPIARRGGAKRLAHALVERLRIVTPSVYTPVRRLSGGNVQKVLLGREIESAPQVLITAYPVRGLDINASYTIYDLLNEQKKRGVGILFIGEDLDVLLELCDRILVLCGGRVTGIVDARTATKADLGRLMMGAQVQSAQAETTTPREGETA